MNNDTLIAIQITIALTLIAVQIARIIAEKKRVDIKLVTYKKRVALATLFDCQRFSFLNTHTTPAHITHQITKLVTSEPTNSTIGARLLANQISTQITVLACAPRVQMDTWGGFGSVMGTPLCF